MRRCIATHALYLANLRKRMNWFRRPTRGHLGQSASRPRTQWRKFGLGCSPSCRNIWQNERRRQSREHEVWLDEAIAPTTQESPETLMSQKLLVSEVREAVDSIPVHWREIVVMRDIEELSYNEIASILGCPIGTVMSRLARARQP